MTEDEKQKKAGLLREKLLTVLYDFMKEHEHEIDPGSDLDIGASALIGGTILISRRAGMTLNMIEEGIRSIFIQEREGMH